MCQEKETKNKHFGQSRISFIIHNNMSGFDKRNQHFAIVKTFA